VLLGLKAWRLALMFASQDVRQRYRRSVIGPFWITISMLIVICAIGFIFGALLEAPADELMPFLSVGIILWTFIQSTVAEGCNSFTSGEAIIKQIPLPLFVQVERVVFRNLIILAHNAVIIPLLFLFLKSGSNGWILFILPGLVALVLCLSAVVLALAILCTRFRDIAQIVANLLQMFFYVTPIIWLPALLQDKGKGWVMDVNPLYHLIEIVRAPVLGSAPSRLSWTIVLGVCILSWIIALLLFNRFRRRIAYWL
jgi:lipopolysaccharide transport system permease protein